MLQRTEQARGLPYDNGVAPRHFDLVDVYAFLKSNRRVLAAWVIVALTIALVYAFTATPLYTAIVDLTIDSKKIQLFKDKEQVIGDNNMDSSQVESEVQVLSSESLAVAVIDDLKLTNDPEFLGTGNGPIVGLLSAIFGMDEDARSLSDVQRKRIAIRSFAAISAYGASVLLTYSKFRTAHRIPRRQRKSPTRSPMRTSMISSTPNIKRRGAPASGSRSE